VSILSHIIRKRAQHTVSKTVRDGSKALAEGVPVLIVDRLWTKRVLHNVGEHDEQTPTQARATNPADIVVVRGVIQHGEYKSRSNRKRRGVPRIDL
jgi:hypothetical protein